ncbi:hypothetical protein [Extensimonas vulgaris]|uniref:Uncharacterized protein n=1 Tax=Extensimonas vulgaris TaxID=1031594 RepID=A0A369AK83_9BURK|nr:hypothetical protein [Extensimonas vulgaris]RCX09819.1 hypothetical protein DFR45_104189 [Extensimonas vulgaris]TWI39449.1 hypothetical protein IP95_01355 [Extensimonas vulgaris]TXD13011.1 hypothetical protein FUT63_12460 [Extensimonas vulgaris]
MVLSKTSAGLAALKDRHGGLTPRQRAAFILFDGKRSTAEVLAATAAIGITQADVQAMLEQGLLCATEGFSESVLTASMAASPDETPSAVADETVAVESSQGSGRSDMERYQAAYPIAIQLTAGLGLRGFRLNLAVESAHGYADLATLAPKIRDAVGDAKYAALARVLFD